MITSSESIRDVFSIFHDGMIEKAEFSGGVIKLTIGITYLAERVQSGFGFFYVELYGFRNVEFHAWIGTLENEKVLITDPAVIFKLELEILSANLKGDCFEIICNIPSYLNSDYIGGELLFRANSAQVYDEAGKEYSISELTEICSGYWNEWKLKNAKHVKLVHRETTSPTVIRHGLLSRKKLKKKE